MITPLNGGRMYGGQCAHTTLRMLVHTAEHAQQSSWQCAAPCGCTITLSSHEPAPDRNGT